MTPTLRLGRIAYLNTLPVYFGLDLPDGVEIHQGHPSDMNAGIREGNLDVAPVSSAFYLAHADEMVMLGDLAIGSPGAVESVLLVSTLPWQRLGELPTIGVPHSSATSIALLRYLLAQDGLLWRGGPRLIPYQDTGEGSVQAALLQHSAALVIGDTALKSSLTVPHGMHVTDLSLAWHRRTGLPFVFAVWAARRDWAEANATALRQLNTALVDARRRFFADPVVFGAGLEDAQQSSGLPAPLLKDYYTRALDYRFGAPQRDALRRFGEAMLRPATRDIASVPR